MNKSDYIKQQVTVIEVLEDYFGIITKNKGKIKCLNPDHEDRTPSMHIYLNTNNNRHSVCRCFSCGTSYDVINLVMLATGKPFKEALYELMKTYEVKTEETPQDKFNKWLWIKRQYEGDQIKQKMIDTKKIIKIFTSKFKTMEDLENNLWMYYYMSYVDEWIDYIERVPAIEFVPNWMDNFESSREWRQRKSLLITHRPNK
ncbi:CHC2 zinc finger domain-containing protein [Bacillus cereus group sp. BfR-BA-01318]|uniref:CHC2 zinc finger domain-containing protein n=1 Tax=Bacillus cereus group sp. BfR-BA-01318 TaxID=2920295 RepID=UPI001F5AB76E|nr:CHC2 zinc finger domain-containing protein [Bacillus cereus group sp. BfR-BA-01318]